MQDKDPIREALEEILAQAKRYQSEPLMSKLKGKMKVSVVELPEPDLKEDEPVVETTESEEDRPELTDEQKKKLLELLGG